jgi:hypothetical protein
MTKQEFKQQEQHQPPVYFYSRNDSGQILAELSPLRSTLQRAIPHLYYLGLLTNILCIVVLLQKRMLTRRKSLIYLIVLSVSDFMYSLLSQLPDFLVSARVVAHDIFKVSNLACFFYDYRMTSFHFFSVLLTLFVTVDRFYHIYQPLIKLNRKYSSSSAKLVVCAGLALAAFVVALPHGFLMVYNPAERDCDARDFFKQKFRNTTFTNYQIYFTFLEPLLIWFIPGLLILVMNSYVIFKIMQSNKKRRCNHYDQVNLKSMKNSHAASRGLHDRSRALLRGARKNGHAGEDRMSFGDAAHARHILSPLEHPSRKMRSPVSLLVISSRISAFKKARQKQASSQQSSPMTVSIEATAQNNNSGNEKMVMISSKENVNGFHAMHEANHTNAMCACNQTRHNGLNYHHHRHQSHSSKIVQFILIVFNFEIASKSWLTFS